MTIEAGPVLDLIERGQPPRQRPTRVRGPLALIAFVVAAGLAVPAVYLVVRAADAGWDAVRDTVLDARTLSLLFRTVGLAGAVTVAAAAIGVLVAWLTVRTDLPGRRVWTVLLALPLVVPSFVAGYVFVAALGPKGIIQGLLAPLGIDRLPSIYGFGGAWLVLTLFTYPYVFLTVRSALQNIDPALEEVSRSLGHGSLATFRYVVLPQMRPTVIAGSLLAALYTLHDFGAVSLLRFDSFTRAIYLQYQGSFDRSRAALLSLILVALTVSVLAIEARTRGGAAYRVSRSGATRAAPKARLGVWRWPALTLCAGIVVVALVLPMGVVVYWLARGIRGGEPLAFAVTAGWNSLRVSMLGAVLALAAAWPVSVFSVRQPGGASRFVERVSFIGYSLPGLVVALSLVFVGARYVPSFYQTLPMLAFAYVVLFLPQASGALRGSLLQLNPTLEEAAQSLGSGWAERTRRIVLPLVRPGMLAGLALVFLTAMKELPATLLLAPTGFSTLATEVWSAANTASFARGSVATLALIVLASGPLAVLVLHRSHPSR